MCTFNEEFIVNEYMSGKSQVQIANSLNTYNTTIRRILVRHNVPLISSADRNRFVKTDIFSKLEDPETNYWFGMLATDGCVTNGNIVLDLQLEDKELMEQYIKFTNSPLVLNITTHYTGVKSYRVAFRNKDCVNTLKKIGITERKSATLKLNIDITYDLLRGAIDGDGCFSKVNKNACRLEMSSGSERFLKQIEQFLLQEGFHPKMTKSKKNRKNVLYSIALYRKGELLKLYDKLYIDAYPFMKRKKDKFGSLLQKWSENTGLKRGKGITNPVLADSLELQLDNDCQASVETLHPAPELCKDGEEKVQVE